MESSNESSNEKQLDNSLATTFAKLGLSEKTQELKNIAAVEENNENVDKTFEGRDLQAHQQCKTRNEPRAKLIINNFFQICFARKKPRTLANCCSS